MTKILFFDVETTGLDSKINGIHQLSGLIEIDGEIKESFDFKINPSPELAVDAEALKISGKTLEEIRSYPSEALVYRQFVAMLLKYIEKFNNRDKAFLAGWNNAHFDNDFLRAFFIRNNDKFFGSWFWSNPIDVMVLASQCLIEERAEMINFKLMTVATFLLGKIDQSKLHDAQYDIELTRNIYHIVKF